VRAGQGLRAALRVLAFVVLVALALAGCGGSGTTASTSDSTPKASFSALIGAGMHLLRQGNASGAQQVFAQAVGRKPVNPVGHYDLGVALQREGHLREALRQYRLALARDPRYTPALFNEAVLVAPHDPALAIFYYRHIVAIRPNSSTAFLNLGLLQAATGWPRRLVLRSLRRAVSLDPRLRAHIPARLRHGL
jgi:Tfp pilus assembly protein PilF